MTATVSAAKNEFFPLAKCVLLLWKPVATCMTLCDTPRSVVIIAPTSRSARAASFRPSVVVAGEATRVLVEQLGAVDAQRLGRRAGRLTNDEMWAVDDALLTVLGLN